MKVNEIIESLEPLDDWHKLESKLLQQKSWKPAKSTYTDGYGNKYTAVKLAAYGLTIIYDPDYGTTIAGTGGNNKSIDTFEEVKKYVDEAKTFNKRMKTREVRDGRFD